jgi:Reverse transcriptase (RNA-dependent DNA polymerase)
MPPRINISTELAIQQEKQKEKKSWRQIVPKKYHEFKDVLTKKEFDQLPPNHPWDHAIELWPDAVTSVKGKVYPMDSKHEEELQKFLDENLSTNRIRPLNSLIASSFFFIKKKDGALWPVQDYCQLNEKMVWDQYPIPLIPNIINSLQQSEWFTKLDICWGYNNIQIKSGDEWKAAFITKFGLFEPTVMFFGLCNSPATFQRMMNTILEDMITAGHVLVYIDDIMIHSPGSLSQHISLVWQVLIWLCKHKLYLKPEKCEFHKKEVEYLGQIISKGQVAIDPVKTDAVKTWPVPINKRELQQFLEFCNYYQKFIEGFSKLSNPLQLLVGKNDWN